MLTLRYVKVIKGYFCCKYNMLEAHFQAGDLEPFRATYKTLRTAVNICVQEAAHLQSLVNSLTAAVEQVY